MNLAPRRVMAARAVAVVADAVQIGLLPMFVEGALSPVNDALDVAVALAMFALLGWHWAFLPAFLSELVPVFDLVPTWTAAVLVATRRAGRAEAAKAVTPQASAPARAEAAPRPPAS